MEFGGNFSPLAGHDNEAKVVPSESSTFKRVKEICLGKLKKL